MPKLSNVKEKYVNGYQVDKETEDVIYSDAKHLYLDKYDNKPYVSVTTLIHKYVNEFDSAFWSAYKACEALVEPEIFKVVKTTLLNTKRWNPTLLEKLNINEEEFENKRAEILQYPPHSRQMFRQKKVVRFVLAPFQHYGLHKYRSQPLFL